MSASASAASGPFALTGSKPWRITSSTHSRGVSRHVCPIAILDDEQPGEFGHLAPWHVQTDFMQGGLQPHHVEQAVELLSRDRDDTLRLAYSAQRDVFRPC